uniref:G_PROTEIN_RECEP_F1_2 domain-containing protein n=1 Tax=Ascaris lumbricoides TaxID=6252 RepID=A0A0M3HSV6_ASCLU
MTRVLIITNPSMQSFLLVLSGQIANGMFYASILLSLIMAANRFCAITFSTIYSRLFTRRCAIKSVLIIWIISLLMCSPYYFGNKYDLNSLELTICQSSRCPRQCDI